MKVFERAVQKQLVTFLKANSILCEQQSGFRECHSTHTATSDVSDFILQNMDKGLFTGAVYLDLKKAFDTVDFQTLLFKLRCLGIKMLNTFGLKTICKIDNSVSHTTPANRTTSVCLVVCHKGPFSDQYCLFFS